MKREIKFRGKRIDNGEWAYGSLIITNKINLYEIYCRYDKIFKVIPETVGQFAGLPFNIFENDIIQSRLHPTAIYVVIWNEINCCFSAFHISQYNQMNKEDDLFRLNMLCNKTSISPNWLSEYQFEPIGNIYDNSELLKA